MAYSINVCKYIYMCVFIYVYIYYPLLLSYTVHVTCVSHLFSHAIYAIFELFHLTLKIVMQGCARIKPI